MAAEVNGDFPLHESVFNGNVRQVSALLRVQDVSQKDTHGNTPLHLAVMLGHKECVQLLLAHGAPVKVKNNSGWTPLAEAVSYGDRQTILSLLRKLKQQSLDAMEQRRPNLISALESIGDFKMELKWDFQSWIPLVSRFLPSDICKIHKSGSSIRLDSTLVDFNDMTWERGDISFLFNGSVLRSESLTVLDNKAKVYQRARYQVTEAEIEDEVNLLMGSDIVSAQMSTKSINFTRAQSGWVFREDKTEVVGHFSADFYIINGLILESKKRREHLSDEDLQKNKAIMESFTKGSSVVMEQIEKPQKRKSLKSPMPTLVTWDQYISAVPSYSPQLGREPVCKEVFKSFKANLAMSEDFPLSIDSLLNVLEVIAPFKHFSKIRDFVQMKLPPGFPVKFDMPVLPTVTGRVTFQDFEFKDDIPDSMFQIPSNYVEDSERFPDL
ncbi:Ankyrin repeat domain-containing protein 13C [Nymphon striatum]|nr:Ankyrin repeat domain-containing protein 13C [Nymphon striatum]